MVAYVGRGNVLWLHTFVILEPISNKQIMMYGLFNSIILLFVGSILLVFGNVKKLVKCGQVSKIVNFLEKNK